MKMQQFQYVFIHRIFFFFFENKLTAFTLNYFKLFAQNELIFFSCNIFIDSIYIVPLHKQTNKQKDRV